MDSDKRICRYRERSPRLTGYDYSSEGAYFITICTLQREHFFGRIESGKVIKTIPGELAEKFWKEIPDHYPFIKIDEFVIMPDHIHGILIIHQILDGDIAGTPDPGVSPDLAVPPETKTPDGNIVGTPNLGVPADPDVPPDLAVPPETKTPDGNIVGTPNLGVPADPDVPSDLVVPPETKTPDGNIVGTPNLGVPTSITINHIGGKNVYWKPNSIGSIINQYKRICTITIRSMGIYFSWQPRFYDRVIRSDIELQHIRKYIIENPRKWNSGKKCH